MFLDGCSGGSSTNDSVPPGLWPELGVAGSPESKSLFYGSSCRWICLIFELTFSITMRDL
jgi:hypothetical protein